jgi:hypothetical protein
MVRPLLALGLLALAATTVGAGDGDGGDNDELRASLTSLKLGALSKRAVASGVDAARLEEAQNADEPREAVLELLLSELRVPRGRTERLNSKTPYSAGLARRLAEVERASAAAATAVARCEPIAAYGVLRHGTRYPTAKDRKKMAQLGERLRVHDPAALPASLRWLGNWTPAVPEEEDGTLHRIGRLEQHALARRLQARYPALFPALLGQDRAYIGSATAKPRTQQSARAFAAGLAGLPPATEAEDALLPQLQHAPLDADRLLRSHTMCPRYTAAIKENSTLDDGGVVKGTSSGALRPAVARNVRSALHRAGVSLAPRAAAPAAGSCSSDADGDGGKGHGACDPGDAQSEWEIDDASMKAIWKACQWETLLEIDSTRSDWCGLLSNEDIRMLELLGDLDVYWEKGPGLRLPSLIACELLQDVVAKLGRWAAVDSSPQQPSAAEAEGEATTTLRFAHAETVLPLLGILGIDAGQTTPLITPTTAAATVSATGGADPNKGTDEDGAADATQQTTAMRALEALKARSWRSSLIAPMSANVVLLLQHCQATTGDSGGAPASSQGQEQEEAAGVVDGMFVTVLHNEVPVAIPGCADAAAASPLATSGGVDAQGMPLLCPWEGGFLAQFDAELNDCNLDELCRVHADDDKEKDKDKDKNKRKEKDKEEKDDADEQKPAGSEAGAVQDQLADTEPDMGVEATQDGPPVPHGTRSTTRAMLGKVGVGIVLGLVGLTCVFCACMDDADMQGSEMRKLYKSNHAKLD